MRSFSSIFTLILQLVVIISYAQAPNNIGLQQSRQNQAVKTQEQNDKILRQNGYAPPQTLGLSAATVGSVYTPPQIRQRQELEALLQEEKKEADNLYSYFNSAQFLEDSRYYRAALEEIEKMLKGEQQLSLKRAIFLVENAYSDNKLNYIDYENKIAALLNFCKSYLKQNGFNENDKVAKNYVLYRLYSQTIEIKDNSKIQKHEPFKYDFNDFWGNEDWANQFVTKLLRTNTGQCHSMPLLYMILAQEWGTDAYMSFSPNHSFIKFKDNKGSLYNLETTNGNLVTDKWIMTPQFIKSEAIQNGLYLDTISYSKVIANCLNDLADGFQIKFMAGDWKFLLQCSDVSLKYFPKGNFHAISNKSNVYLFAFDLMRKYNKVSKKRNDMSEFFIRNPDAKKLWELHDQYYMEVQNMGFEKMPEEAYKAWLASVDEEKNKSESAKLTSSIKSK